MRNNTMQGLNLKIKATIVKDRETMAYYIISILFSRLSQTFYSAALSF